MLFPIMAIATNADFLISVPFYIYPIVEFDGLYGSCILIF